MKGSYQKLRLLLGDQLNHDHSWFKRIDPSCIYLVAEHRQECDYTPHHIQKICAFFLSMERFAAHLRKSGHQVIHLNLDETSRYESLTSLIRHLCSEYKVTSFEYQQPDEYRLLEQLRSLDLNDEITVQEYDTEHFFLDYDSIPKNFSKNQAYKMEFFYRRMRKEHHILLDDDRNPEGGKWNFDSDNRKKIPTKEISTIPKAFRFENDVTTILNRIKSHKIKTIGKEENVLLWPCDRIQALELLTYFCERCLPSFGTYQDAMTCKSYDQWSLWHSRLSFAINVKLLSPKEVIEEAVNQYKSHDSQITLSQIEGFVRQILGWREFIRAMYWVNMPEYENQNSLNASRSLPGYFWSGNTKMNCLHHAISQSLEYAYAHHIQRLMITGNFCLLSGISPKEVDEWYLSIYIDAIQWVELPNTRGMSQFADDGLIATKPYAAGGNYVNKMSDYCKGCAYKIKEKTTSDSCPLNSMYWNFMIKHRKKLENNPRIGMIYRTWDKQEKPQRQAILARAKWCLQNLEDL